MTDRDRRRLPDPVPRSRRSNTCSTVGATVTACTHLGRPEGAPDVRWELAPVREELARLAPKVELLENLRFDPGEEHNDPAFVEKLVNSHDAYVNDAFGVSHRRHASVVGPPTRLPSAAGLPARTRARGARHAARRSGPALRGGRRRRQGRRQARSPRVVARAGRRTPRGWRDGVHLPRRCGPLGGRLPGRPGPDRRVRGGCSARPTRSTFPPTWWRSNPVPTFGCGCVEGKVVTVGAGRSRGMAGLDIGPETVADYARTIAGAGTRALERADGCVRGRAVLRRDGRHRPGGGGVSTVSPSSAAATARRPSTSSG